MYRLTVLVTLVFALQTAHATVIYSRDFEGAQSPAGGWDIHSRNNILSNFSETLDSGDLFGLGTGNHYAAYHKQGGAEGHLQVLSNRSTVGGANPVAGSGPGTWTSPASGIQTVTFDFYSPASSTGLVNFRVGNGETIEASASTDRFNVTFNNGQLASVPTGTFDIRDRLLRFEMVINHSGSALTSYHDGNDLANNRADIYLFDYLTSTRTHISPNWDDINSDDGNISRTWSPGTTMTMALLNFNGNVAVDLYLDNVAVHDEVFLPSGIPEPGTIGLLGLAVLLLRCLRSQN